MLEMSGAMSSVPFLRTLLLRLLNIMLFGSVGRVVLFKVCISDFEVKIKAPPMDHVTLKVRVRPEKECNELVDMKLPIIAPHLLTCWMLEQGCLSCDPDSAQRWWSHHRRQKFPWMHTPGFHSEDQTANFQPFALYGDEAEYSLTKENIFVIFASSQSSICKLLTCLPSPTTSCTYLRLSTSGGEICVAKQMATFCGAFRKNPGLRKSGTCVGVPGVQHQCYVQRQIPKKKYGWGDFGSFRVSSAWGSNVCRVEIPAVRVSRRLAASRSQLQSSWPLHS